MISAFAARQVATQQRAKTAADQLVAARETEAKMLRAQAENALREGAPATVLRLAEDERKAAEMAAAAAKLAAATTAGGAQALREAAEGGRGAGVVFAAGAAREAANRG